MFKLLSDELSVVCPCLYCVFLAISADVDYSGRNNAVNYMVPPSEEHYGLFGVFLMEKSQEHTWEAAGLYCNCFRYEMTLPSSFAVFFFFFILSGFVC